MIPTIYLHRFEFHQRFSYGKILDVGCADGSGWAFPIPIDSITNPPNIKHITFADCDEWKNQFNMPFVRCFAEDIPLPDKSFDTVCLGDILEHVKDPDKVILEAKRLTKDRIVITVPNEWKWEKNNPNIKAFETRKKHLEDGKDLKKLGYEQTIKHPSGSCIDALDDTKFEHIHHERFYNEETFTELIKKNSDEMEYYIFNIKYNSLNFVNLAVLMWFK